MAEKTDVPKPKGAPSYTPKNTNMHKLAQMGKNPDFGQKSMQKPRP